MCLINPAEQYQKYQYKTSAYISDESPDDGLVVCITNA